MIERIGIIGAGAIGRVVGGMRARAGRSVTMVPVKARRGHELQSVT